MKEQKCECGFEDCNEIAPYPIEMRCVNIYCQCNECKKTRAMHWNEAMRSPSTFKASDNCTCDACIETRIQEDKEEYATSIEKGDTIIIEGKNVTVVLCENRDENYVFIVWNHPDYDNNQLTGMKLSDILKVEKQPEIEEVGGLVAIKGSPYLRRETVHTSDHMHGYIRKNGKTIPVRSYDGMGKWFQKDMPRSVVNARFAQGKVL